MIQENRNLNLIQLLRGVASLLVVFYHATSNSNNILKEDFIFNFFSLGASGVDVFFVLSGFIITYTSIKGASQPGKLLPFLRRRAVRIFPTYWIIATFFLGLQILLPSFYKTHYDFNFGNITSTYLLFPGHLMVNSVSWTLSYELFFYLMFTLIFLLPNKKWAFMIFMIYALVLMTLPVAGYSFENGKGWINFICFPMNVEFFMGVLAALIIPKIPVGFSLPLIFTGSFMFIASGIFYDQEYQFLANSFNRVLLFGIPSFIIIIGLVKYELTHRVTMHKVFLSLGEASYSIYLLHLPVIVAFTKIILLFNINSNMVIQLLLILLIVAICFISILFYKFIEKPVIRKLNKTLNKKNLFGTSKMQHLL